MYPEADEREIGIVRAAHVETTASRVQVQQDPEITEPQIGVDSGGVFAGDFASARIDVERNVAVTATKKSQATSACAWFFRNVAQR